VANAADIELKWTEPGEDGLVKFLCGERLFSEERVRSDAKKLLKSKQSQTQVHLNRFCKTLPSTPNATNAAKRKAEEAKNVLPNNPTKHKPQALQLW
ncbi:hypothetical protein KR018_007737, partial [Drosophila ironensis]